MKQRDDFTDVPIRLKLASDFVCAAIAVLLSAADQGVEKERAYVEKFLHSLANAIYNGNINGKSGGTQ